MTRSDWMTILIIFFAVGQVAHWWSLWMVGKSTGAFPNGATSSSSGGGMLGGIRPRGR